MVEIWVLMGIWDSDSEEIVDGRESGQPKLSSIGNSHMCLQQDPWASH